MTSAVLLPMSFARGCDVNRLFFQFPGTVRIPGLYFSSGES